MHVYSLFGRGQVRTVKKDQHNSYLVGKSIYTDTLVDAKKLLEEWKGSAKKSAPPQQQPENEPGVGFVEAGTATKERKWAKTLFVMAAVKKDTIFLHATKLLTQTKSVS